MDSLYVIAPALGCILMMVPMMWFMSRAMNQGDQSSSSQPSAPVGQDSELAELQTELGRLRAKARAQSSKTTQDRT